MKTLKCWDVVKLESELEYNYRLIRIVLDQFLIDLETLVDQMLDCIDSKKACNSTFIEKLAHALKGASAQVHCERLSMICSQIENDFRGNMESPTLPEDLLRQEVEAVKAMIFSYLKIDKK